MTSEETIKEQADLLADVLYDLVESLIDGQPSEELVNRGWSVWADYYRRFQEEEKE